MTDIFNRLNSLKNKLNDLEQTVTTEVKREEIQGIYKDRVDKKLPLIREMQNSKLIINAGDEDILVTSKTTISRFPYKLSLKEEIKFLGTEEELYIDTSLHLFSPILEIIRFLAENPNPESKKKLVIESHPDAIKVHAKEFFLEDTEKVINNFELIYSPPWVKRKVEQKSRQDPNKWPKDTYVCCYSCGTQNDGTHWRKKATYDRANDNYCIDNYIATCLNCDPGNTLQY